MVSHVKSEYHNRNIALYRSSSQFKFYMRQMRHIERLANELIKGIIKTAVEYQKTSLDITTTI